LESLVSSLFTYDVATAALNWENYEHRRSLIRALRFTAEMGAVRLVEGDNEQFALQRESEALYEVTLLARYVLRSYPKDLH
jgi:uncharacterized protein (TIGR02678 family)